MGARMSEYDIGAVAVEVDRTTGQISVRTIGLDGSSEAMDLLLYGIKSLYGKSEVPEPEIVGTRPS
jgi:hypothetical protein